MSGIESLRIERIRRCYTEDIIINIFWKNFLGKVYRVDFEAIVYDDVPGTWDFEYQKADIYKDEKCEWSPEIIKSINETGHFILYYTNSEGKNECWTMYKNPNPIPKTNTTNNIHQLADLSRRQWKKIVELDEENKKLKAQIDEYKKKTNTDDIASP
jgi:hypothetical protein